MSTSIFYYTGTGNSLWIAREIGRLIPDASLYSMSKDLDVASINKSDLVGLVFPVHIWGLPHRVMDFLEKIPLDSKKYVFAVAVNAGQVSRTLVQLDEELQKRGTTLASGFSIKMPSNYIPWGGPCTQEEQGRLFEKAKEKALMIATHVQSKKEGPIEKGPLWQRLLFTLIYNASIKHVSDMDKKFWVDEKCTECAICAKVCPTKNITLTPKPTWHHHCEQCLACIQWCPTKAIQYGRKTPGYERYHHPDVGVKDLF